MRNAILVAIAASQLASTLPTQEGQSLASADMPILKITKTENLASKFPKEKGSKRVRVTVGPINVDPGNAKHAAVPGRMDPNSQMLNAFVEGLPSDALYLSTETKMTYPDGTEADIVNGYYNHHFIMADVTKSTPKPGTEPAKVIACADGKNAGMPVDPFGGASEANRDLFFVTPENEFNGGYYVAKGDRIMVSAEIINYTNNTKTLFSVTEIEYIPGKPKDAMAVGLQVMNVGTCAPKPAAGGQGGHGAHGGHDAMEGMVMGPKGEKKFSLSSNPVIVQKDGYILYRRGHMHDGGEAVRFKVNGKVICDSKAGYGGATQTMKGGVDGKGQNWDTISSMAACRDVVPVKKGDQLTIDAAFDLEKHPARESGKDDGHKGEQMGLMTFMFAAKAPSS